MGRTAQHHHVFETASGFCGVAWNDRGITRFQLPTRSAEATERLLRRRAPGVEPGPPTPEVAEAIAAAKRYFEGVETDFSGFSLDLGDQDMFCKQIYAAARRVGWGRTTTYGTLAKELGAGPEAARDVGQAMARNPVALIIPCHRVLAAGGKVGGFSAPGGAAAKIRMLELEGVHLEPRRRLSTPSGSSAQAHWDDAVSPHSSCPALCRKRSSESFVCVRALGRFREGAVSRRGRGRHRGRHQRPAAARSRHRGHRRPDRPRAPAAGRRRGRHHRQQPLARRLSAGAQGAAGAVGRDRGRSDRPRGVARRRRDLQRLRPPDRDRRIHPDGDAGAAPPVLRDFAASSASAAPGARAGSRAGRRTARCAARPWASSATAGSGARWRAARPRSAAISSPPTARRASPRPGSSGSSRSPSSTGCCPYATPLRCAQRSGPRPPG